MSTDEQQMPQYPLAKTFLGRAMDLDPTKTMTCISMSGTNSKKELKLKYLCE